MKTANTQGYSIEGSVYELHICIQLIQLHELISLLKSPLKAEVCKLFCGSLLSEFSEDAIRVWIYFCSSVNYSIIFKMVVSMVLSP